jgi:hypothetical protein
MTGTLSQANVRRSLNTRREINVKVNNFYAGLIEVA